MLRVSLLLFLWGVCVLCKDYKCGPYDKCVCHGTIRPKAIFMDCSNQDLDICDVCDGVGNATDLDLSNNSITVVHRSCLRKCRNLQSLTLTNNSIQYFDDAFEGMDRLKQLDLSSNLLDIYEKNGRQSIPPLPCLVVLKIQKNLNKSLVRDVSYPDISPLQSLDTLYIDGLSNTPFGHSYGHLRKLNMSGFSGICNLHLITNNTFMNLNKLQVLDISSCNVTNIYAGGFKEVHKLEQLNMSYNQQLGFATFRNVSYSLQSTNIKTLNMSKVYNTFGIGTTFRKRHVCYLRNTTLQELALDSNRIALFEANVMQLLPPTLKIVHANDNKFTFGPYLLQGSCAPNVTEVYLNFLNSYHDPDLYLSETQDIETLEENSMDDCPFMTDEYLQNISRSIHHCHFINSSVRSLAGPSLPPALKRCEFHDCNMEYAVKRILVNPRNVIESVDLSGNILNSWQGPVGPVGSLKYVDLSRNYCSNISKYFFQYTDSLENLQIQHNFIGLILSENSSVGIFNSLTALKTLNLSNNHITTIAERLFSNLYSLVTLDLSFNDIGEWSVQDSELTNLTHLNISFNAFRTLPESIMSHFESMDKRNESFSVNMRGNTISCTCEYKQFLHWMVNYKTNFVDYKHYIFKDMDGSRMSETAFEKVVEIIDKRCASYVTYIVVGVLTLSVSISIIIGGVIYKNRWKLRYLLYMSKNRFFGYKRIQNEEVLENYRYDAFISYAEENIRFILDGIIPNLDEISLCIHQRDFLAGNAVTDNIIDAIQSSRRTVVILSKAFLTSKWCMYEFNMARMESIYTRPGRRTLIVVMYEDVPMKDMPNEMSHWIMTESYLEYTEDRHGQVVFWNNLAHALGVDID